MSYWISGFSNDTTINMLLKHGLEMPLSVVPRADLMRKFNAMAAAVHSQVEAMLQQYSAVAAIRDAPLPKLLSGQLRAPVANRLLVRTSRALPNESHP
jgi:hypothetical protein